MVLYERLEHFGAVVFNAENGRYYQLDHAAAEAIRRACTHPAQRSPAPLSLPLGPSIGVSSRISEAPRFVCIENPRAHPLALSAPLKAFLDITRRCNLCCSHCYSASGGETAPELASSVILSTLEQLQTHGIMRVTISGGEPLCHSEILPILSMIRCFDIDFSLITNAVGLTDTIVERLSTIANLRSVTVSIDGASAETNDLVRGEGAFVRAIAGLRRLIRTYKGTIAVRTTLMRTNFDSMEDLAALVAQFGVTEIKANRMNPYGRGASHPDLLLSDATYHAARDVLLKAAALHGLRVEIPSQKYQVDVDGRLGLCRAGEETFQIDADGSVYPCSFTFGGLLCGNVVSDSFGDILTRLQTHSINNQHCYSCRGRGGSGEKPVGYVPQLMVRSGQESSQEQ